MILHSAENQLALASLQRRWRFFLLCCALFSAGGALLLAWLWRPAYAGGWVVATIAVLMYQLWLLRSSLEENHRLGETALFPGLGWGNIFSLTRGVLFAGLTGFVFLPKPPGALAWAPALLYTVGALIDFLDGYAARLANQVTQLGEKLDMSLDGWGMLVASILAVRYGQVPTWYLLVGAARYLFLAGLWLRQRLGWTVSDLPPRVARRMFAGIQMGFAFVMLWPVFQPPGTHQAAAVFALPFLVNFLLDWLVVSQTVAADFDRHWQALGRFALRWLPWGLRLGVVGMLTPTLAKGWTSLLSQPGGLAGIEGADSQGTAVLLLLLETGAAGCIALGVMGRVAAVVGLVSLGIHQFFQPLSAMQMILIWVYGGLIYLGTGAFSLWKPEDFLIYRRAGEKLP